MSTAVELVSEQKHGELVANIVLKGDLSGLSLPDRVSYYNAICERVGLDPMTQPFSLLSLQGKIILYANKSCTEQLRKIHGVSVTDVVPSQVGDVYVVTVKGSDKSGRTDGATGAVTIANLKGDALANALMKAETKAKRRFTLSICGLGMLDETEIETIPGAREITMVSPQIDTPPDPPAEKPKPVFDKRAWLKGRYLKLHRSKWLTTEDKTAMKEKMADANKDLEKIEVLVKGFESIATAMAQAAGDESYKAWISELEAAVDVGEIEL
jgi:hypothetical protein